MAKLGTYSYPDIRFGDAVGIAARILKFPNASTTPKGLAWELRMAENSGTLFAKIAALRDFGLVEGRGELRISDLARRIIVSSNDGDSRGAHVQSFQRVELLRMLYERFEGEAPDDASLLLALEEITRAPREEIVRRFVLIQKHLGDIARAMRRGAVPAESDSSGAQIADLATEEPLPGLFVAAGPVRFSAPFTVEYIDLVIALLRVVRETLLTGERGEVK